MRSLLLGLDVSPRRMGWGLVDLVTGEPVACGCEAIDLPQHGWSQRQVCQALWDISQRHFFYPGNAELQAVYIEMPALPPGSGTKGAFNAGRAVQAVSDEVGSLWPWAPVEYLQPAEWRKLAGLKGNASKQDVWEHVFLEIGPRHLDMGSISEQDACDAICIAVAGQRRNGENWQRAVDRGEAA